MGRKHSVLYVISCPLAGRLTRALVGVAPRRGQCDDPRYKADTHFITIVLGYHHHAASCSTSYCLARAPATPTPCQRTFFLIIRTRTAARIWRFHSASTTAPPDLSATSPTSPGGSRCRSHSTSSISMKSTHMRPRQDVVIIRGTSL